MKDLVFIQFLFFRWSWYLIWLCQSLRRTDDCFYDCFSAEGKKFSIMMRGVSFEMKKDHKNDVTIEGYFLDIRLIWNWQDYTSYTQLHHISINFEYIVSACFSIYKSEVSDSTSIRYQFWSIKVCTILYIEMGYILYSISILQN